LDSQEIFGDLNLYTATTLVSSNPFKIGSFIVPYKSARNSAVSNNQYRDSSKSLDRGSRVTSALVTIKEGEYNYESNQNDQ